MYIVGSKYRYAGGVLLNTQLLKFSLKLLTELSLRKPRLKL